LSALGAVSLQAASIAVPAKLIAVELGAAPSIDLVREDCGWAGIAAGWRDRWGYWHWGRCYRNW
jgi:hypothetical protein